MPARKKKITQFTKFGRLLVLLEVGVNKHGKTEYLCRCDCEKSTIVLGESLRSGNTKSCGCKNKENAPNFKHGHLKKGSITYRTYCIWTGMKRRCVDITHANAKYYSLRGITYDPRWEEFENFLEDMGICPEGLTLDRIDVNGNYCKENCRWATKKVQAHNRRISEVQMANYLNGKIEILGSPKTVRLEGQFKGQTFSAPMEVWIMALVATLDDEKKSQFFQLLQNVQSSGEYSKIEKAKIVADIPMPKLF